MARARRKKDAPADGPRAVARAAREDLYREHVLRAAESVFAEEGFETARVQDISRRAGLSMGSIYSLFPGKEQIYRSIREERGAEILHLVREIVGRELSARSTLEALGTAYVEYFHDRPDFLRMQVRAGAAWALSDPAESSPLAAEIHRLQTEVFARGVAAGEVVDEDPAFLEVLFSGIDELHLARWVAGGMHESKAELISRFLRIIRNTFFRAAD